MLLLKVTTAKLKKFEKEYCAMKEEQEDPLERLQVLSTSSIHLILKSYTKYKIDRDRNIAHNTDKNRKKKQKNSAKSTTHITTLFMRHIY